MMYQEKLGPSPKDKSVNIGAAIDQVVSHIPLKLFRKQGLSEVRVISERTLNELIERAVEEELQKRAEAITKERDELRAKTETLSRQIEELTEGSKSLSGEKEKLQRNYKMLEEKVARLQNRLSTASRGGPAAQTTITREKYEEKLREVVENILSKARGMIPADLLEKVKEGLTNELIDKFPHTTHPLAVGHQREAVPATPQPQPSAGTGPVKIGSLFHKLVENNIKWRERQKAQEKQEKES